MHPDTDEDHLNLNIFPDDGEEEIDLGPCWNCTICGEGWRQKTNPRPADGVCLWCIEKRQRETPPPDDAICRSAEVPLCHRAHLSREKWEAQFGQEWRLGDYDPASGRQLLIMGTTGTGKSTAAAIVLLEFARKRRTAAWMNSTETLFLMREADGKSTELYRRAIGVDLLIWDDLWASRTRPTPFAIDSTLMILGRRFEDGKPSIITTGCSADAIIAINAPLGSRLLSGVTKTFEGKDRRLSSARDASGSRKS